MINFNFRISTPWVPAKYDKLHQYKGNFLLWMWELELLHYALDLFCLYFSLNSCSDHAGLRVGISLGGYAINIKIYSIAKTHRKEYSLA